MRDGFGAGIETITNRRGSNPMHSCGDRRVDSDVGGTIHPSQSDIDSGDEVSSAVVITDGGGDGGEEANIIASEFLARKNEVFRITFSIRRKNIISSKRSIDRKIRRSAALEVSANTRRNNFKATNNITKFALIAKVSLEIIEIGGIH